MKIIKWRNWHNSLLPRSIGETEGNEVTMKREESILSLLFDCTGKKWRLRVCSDKSAVTSKRLRNFVLWSNLWNFGMLPNSKPLTRFPSQSYSGLCMPICFSQGALAFVNSRISVLHWKVETPTVRTVSKGMDPLMKSHKLSKCFPWVGRSKESTYLSEYWDV